MSDTLTWTNPNGGVFDTSTNWNPQVQPGTNDIVLFQISTTIPHTYTVTGNGTGNGVEVEGDNVTTTGTITTTGTAELALIDGSMTIAAGAALLEQTAGTGQITVGNASLATSDASLVVNGSVTTGALTIGSATTGSLTATVAVSGAGASLQAAVGVFIDHDGTLDISAGATVSDVAAIVGNQTGPAYAVVTGPNSTWANTTGGLQIGQSNTAGTVTVTNDATVTSTGATLLVDAEGALLLDDTATITGAYELDGGLVEALDAIGQSNFGTITIGNAIELDGGSTSTLEANALTRFDVTGKITGGGKLAVLGGTVELSDAANSFSGGVAVGDEATLAIAASGAQGTGSITFATTSGDTLDNAGTLALLSGVAVSNALIVSSGTATLSIPFGASTALTNSVSGAGVLALEGGTFTLSTPSDEAQTGGLILQSGTLILTDGAQGLGGPLSFGAFGGSSIVWDTAAAPSAATLTIDGFLGDSIVFPDLTFNGETINSGGTVTLTENGVAVGSLVVEGATGNLQVVQYTNSDDQIVSVLTADSAWAAPQSGAFETASNWQYNDAPGSTNIAFFSLNSPTPYTVSGGGTAAAIDVQGDQVTLTGSYTLLGQPASEPGFDPLQVGSDGSLTIAAGASVTGPSAASQFSYVGTGTGGGTLDVLGTLSLGSLIANQGGTVIVSGDAAQVTATGVFGVGYGTVNELAPADLVIENGATVTDASGYVGFSVAATALVTGAGSTWTSTGPSGLNIGNTNEPGRSELTVENSGTVSSTQPIGILSDATLAISPTATIIGAIEALGQSLGGSAVIEAIADPGQTGAGVTVLANAVALESGALVLAGSTDATLDVTGLVSGSAGFLVAVNHVILADAANTLGGAIDIGAPALYPFAGDAGVLEEAATGALGTSTASFTPGANSTLIFDSGVTPTNTVANFAYGDVIDLRGLAFVQGATASVSGDTMTVTSGAESATITVTGIPAGTELLALSDQTGATPGTEVVWAHCFGTGTPIATPDGERPVETLTVGDAVRCADGTVRPIVWAGGWDTDVAGHAWPESVAPVRVRAGAFGPGMPRHDIVLSPDHCVPLDGLLVPIRRLINGATVRQERVRRVRYHHIAVDGHAILLADGLPAESLRDVAQCRQLGAELSALPPARGGGAPCLPLLDDDAIAAALWDRLAARAARLGLAAKRPASIDDPDLHLMVHGRRVRPLHRTGERFTFALPRGGHRVELCSRSAPATATRPWADDRRRLGVAVRRVRLQSGRHADELAPDHRAFVDGWWPIEQAGRQLFRWTDGRGTLDVPQGTRLLTVDLATRTAYPDGPTPVGAAWR